MKVFLVLLFITGFILFMVIVSPKENNYPQSVTRDSLITYKIGEKVIANPYDSGWYSGKIKGIISEDDYIVETCGPFGWFNKYQCNTEQLRRSVIAKQ